jgi:hypothetical protein
MALFHEAWGNAQEKVPPKRALKARIKAAFKSRQIITTKAISGLQNNRRRTRTGESRCQRW